MADYSKLTDSEWRERLSAEQFQVLRQAGTDRPFSGAYDQFKKEGAGTYVCTGCGSTLFESTTKFYDPATQESVTTIRDETMGMTRIEVVCATCQGHLGHVFEGEGFDTPTDQRYCINATSLRFIPDDAADE